jgi:Glycosyl transferase 4-like domain
MRRVLMISPHFPPDATAAAHRVRLLAPHLSVFGWKPTVLAVDERHYEGGLDRDLANLVPSDLEVIRCDALSARWTRLVGVGDVGLRALPGLWRTSSALMTASRFDAVFITIYPTYPALLGPALKRRFNVPFVLDFQDPWVGSWGLTVGPGAHDSPDLKSRLSRALAGWLEPIAVSAADAITAVSDLTYEDVLARTARSRPLVCATLPVGWDPRDLQAMNGAGNRFYDANDGCVHLCYAGTVLPNGVGTLCAFLDAVRRLAEQEPALYRSLRLHFYGTSNQTSGSPPPRVIPLANDRGIADIVSETPVRIGYVDALRVLRDASGILLLGSSERHYTASKLYPALMVRRPLLAVFHQSSSVTSILRGAGRPPSVRLVTFADGQSPSLDAIYADLVALIRRPSLDPLGFDLRAIEPYSARMLASTLAGVLDSVSARDINQVARAG